MTGSIDRATAFRIVGPSIGQPSYMGRGRSPMHPDLAIEPAIDPYGKDGLPLDLSSGPDKGSSPRQSSRKARVLRASIPYSIMGIIRVIKRHSFPPQKSAL